MQNGIIFNCRKTDNMGHGIASQIDTYQWYVDTWPLTAYRGIKREANFDQLPHRCRLLEVEART